MGDTGTRAQASVPVVPTLFDQDQDLITERDSPTGLDGQSFRVRMKVAYKGTGFAGFAPNPGVTTVGGVLSDALERVLGHPIELVCAGRTDAGVHAMGQVVHFDTDKADLDLTMLMRALNKLCAPAIAVRDAQWVSFEFDARHSALARHYRYSIINRAEPDPFSTTTAWYIQEPLDLATMRLGCDPLIGEHDFTAFCRRPKAAAGEPQRSLVRRVRSAMWHDLGEGMLRFDISADAFCHQMVRSIVGTLVEIGLGKKRAGDMRAILSSQDRSRAGQVAPPHGLILWKVDY